MTRLSCRLCSVALLSILTAAPAAAMNFGPRLAVQTSHTDHASAISLGRSHSAGVPAPPVYNGPRYNRPTTFNPNTQFNGVTASANSGNGISTNVPK
jgi:hypothetical protein